MASSHRATIAQTAATPVSSAAAAAKAIEPLLAARRQFRAVIQGTPLSGKTEALIQLVTAACRQWSMVPSQFGVVAVTDVGAHILRRRVAMTIDPTFETDELLFRELSGTVVGIAHLASDQLPIIGTSHVKAVTTEFMIRIARVAGVVLADPSPEDKKFLRERRIEAGKMIALIREARNYDRSLPEAHRLALDRGQRLPPLPLVM